MLDETKGIKKRKSKAFVRTILVAAALGLAAGGTWVGVDHKNRSNNSNLQVQQVTSKPDSEYSGVSKIVENVKPAIVAITATVKEVGRDFFGRPTVNEASGAGSGIIIGQNGYELYIVTNNHVINNASNIVIQFANDTTAKGLVKGAEALSDLAVVSVDIRDLSKDTIKAIRVASLGDSTKCQQGELVVAIGNALGYGQSTTVGYISALDREVVVDQMDLNLFQTDAAINPGNSGGALLNAKGEVIGINSVKYVETSVEGVGYAIPIATAIPIINDLINRVELLDSQRGDLGIGGQDVTEVDSKALNIPMGIYINKIEKGSAAEKAGLKMGDVITGVNGRKVETKEALDNYLQYVKAGATVTLKVAINDNGTYNEKDIEVTLSKK